VTEGTKARGRSVGGVSRRAAARLAWSLWGLVIVLAVASFILRNWIAPESQHQGTWHLEDILWWSVLIPALVPAYATVGALVVARRPGNPVGWLCLALGALVALEDVAWQMPSQYATPALETALGLVEALVFPPLPFMLLLLVFPDGQLPSRRWQFVVWLALGAAGLGSLAVVVGPTTYAGRVAGNVALPVSLLALLASVISLFFRWRGSGGVERQQLKWLAYTGVSIAVALLGGVASGYVSGEYSYPTVLILSVAIAGLTIGVPIAIGLAMLRHHLYDVDLFINRTLVYGSLTVMLALIYFGGVATTQAIFRALTGQEQQPQLAVVVSTLAIAALFMPLRRRIQSFIDRRFYRRKYDARKTLEAFSAKLRNETDLEALSEDLVGVVRETMQPAHVSLWLRPEASPKGAQAD
jgi:hypothetical protein